MDLFSKLASMMPGKKKLLKELEERKLEIEKTIALFDAQIHSLSENYIFSEQVSKLKNDYRDFYKSVADLAIPKEHDLYELISAFYTNRSAPFATHTEILSRLSIARMMSSQLEKAQSMMVFYRISMANPLISSKELLSYLLKTEILLLLVQEAVRH